MFDIGFGELLLVAVISLLVIGPKRMPEAVRTTALWVGRIRRTVTRAYREIEKEVGMDDIKRQLHNEEIMRQFNEQQRKLQRDILGDSAGTTGSKPAGTAQGGAANKPPVAGHPESTPAPGATSASPETDSEPSHSGAQPFSSASTDKDHRGL